MKIVSRGSDLESSGVILGWRGRPRNKPASDGSNEVDCMTFWEAKQRQVGIKPWLLLGGLHLSFPYKFNNGLEAPAGTVH